MSLYLSIGNDPSDGDDAVCERVGRIYREAGPAPQWCKDLRADVSAGQLL